MLRIRFLRLLFFVVFSSSSSLSFAQTIESLQKEILALKAEVQDLKSRSLTCTDGKAVQGTVDKWSPWSTCPTGYQATGLQRIDILGDHNTAINHVNDFVCGEQGCRAWCIGNACTVQARCCKF